MKNITVRSFVRRNATIFGMALAMLVTMVDVAPATESVWEGEVRAVSPTERQEQRGGFRHRQASTGAAIGAALGVLAARKGDYRERTAAGLLGGAIGAGIGSRGDRARYQQTGWDVVVCSSEERRYQRCETLFLDQRPWFREGDLVYVARDRLIFAGRSEAFR
jgi:hypothetical protein